MEEHVLDERKKIREAILCEPIFQKRKPLCEQVGFTAKRHSEDADSYKPME
jgi:hypothetical protein